MQKITVLTSAVLSSACLSEIRGDNIEDFDIESISRTEGQGRIPSAIDPMNDPRSFDENIVTRLTEMPSSGSLQDVPWSGSYWPKNKRGIAYRWQTGQSFNYELKSDSQIAAATPEQIATLSPAEKYDLFASGKDWPLTTRAMGETSPTEASWTGYCHGWAPASMAIEEPNPVTMVNENGIEIPFGSSDIKALLTYFYGDAVTADYLDEDFSIERVGIGTACGSAVATDPSCYDTNPGAFHIALTNMVGIQKVGFVMDVDPTSERWNQPVYRYQSRSLETLPPRESSDPEVVSIKIIQTQVTWGMEIEPQWEPLGPNNQVTKTQDYFYTLELDADNEILGGQWVIRMEDGHFLTLDDAYEGLAEVDKNSDGKPDFDREQISQILYQYYQFPDFLWMQRGTNLPDQFENVWSDYSLMATNMTTRQELYDYFGKLSDIVDASLGNQ